MNNQMQSNGNRFLTNVLPTLSEQDQMDFASLTAQIGDVASKMAQTSDISRKQQLTAQRKQSTVNTIYNGGMPQGQGE